MAPIVMEVTCGAYRLDECAEVQVAILCRTLFVQRPVRARRPFLYSREEVAALKIPVGLTTQAMPNGVIFQKTVVLAVVRFFVATPRTRANHASLDELVTRKQFIEDPAGYPPACWREESGSPQGEARVLVWRGLLPV